MTTLRRSIDETARRTIAERTETLFRRSGALRDGHFVLKSGRHSEAYLEKFQVLQDPGGDERAVLVLGRDPQPQGRDGRRRPRRRPHDRRRDPRVRDRPPAGHPRDLRRGGRVRRRPAARVPARLRDHARRARPARRRHPHDRRLAAGDDPGGRGAGRRDRRVRRARRPVRRPVHADVAHDRPRLPASRAVGARPADLRGRRGLPACAAGEPAVKPGSSGTGLAPA